MSPVISVEHLSKIYRLGQIGTGTFSHDLEVWWAKTRGKPNPMLKIGETDHGNRDGEELWALRDVSFTVEQGEALGIIGRNGAGKSTLLKILSRVTAPTNGRVKVKGRIASLLEVGTGFHPELTGRENITLNGAILGMRKAEISRKFDEIVDFSGVEQFIDTPVKRYSSGMYVRLAFAVAAHLDPEILIVDEVLAVGDAEFQKKCLGKMGEVAEGGRTVLFVSHNMDSVRRLCSRCVLVNGGQVLEDGQPEFVINRYTENVNRKVAEYTQPENTSKSINLRRVTLVDLHGIAKTEFEYREGFILNIEYEVNEPIRSSIVWIAIWTVRGTEVLVTADYDLHPELLGERSPGYYHTSVQVPGFLLNAGNYYVVVGTASYVPIATSYDRVETVFLSVFDSTVYPLAEGSTRSGVLKQMLEWRTQKAR